jgi:hypothetical protein
VSVEVRTLPEEPHGWVNASGLDDVEVLGSVREVASQLTKWVQAGRTTRSGSLFDRAKYAPPDNPYDQMRTARLAVTDDDVVAGVAEVTEGLIFQGARAESPTEDDADVFNQINADLNLDGYLRQAYRELFTYSQVVTATWWGWKDYKIRGRSVVVPKLEKEVDPATGVERFVEPLDPETNRPLKPKKGPRRKKTYRVWCPVRLATLDPLKVVPVGSTIFGAERLAWQATVEEMDTWSGIDDGLVDDAIMTTLFLGPYRPSKAEAAALADLGVDPTRLLELNPQYVWRHTLTKADYDPFPEVRLRSIFRLLDLKNQMMEADRVALVGAANYILLVKKGTKEDPAYPEEIQNLRDNFDVVAKLPVIISDHRLTIEIVTPKNDYTLVAERYDTIDRRLMTRLLGALTATSTGQRNESTLTVARMVARLLENRRHMLKRVIEKKIYDSVAQHPFNAKAGGTGFQDVPNLAFTPRNVQLDNDAQMVSAILATRTSKDLSRQSWLEFLGFDQEVEAQRRELEEELYDPIFQTAIPFNSPANTTGGGPPPPEPSQVSGSRGGRPPGGGNTPQSPQRRVTPRTGRGNPSTGARP